jgi:hypothetical protein
MSFPPTFLLLLTEVLQTARMTVAMIALKFRADECDTPFLRRMAWRMRVSRSTGWSW